MVSSWVWMLLAVQWGAAEVPDASHVRTDESVYVLQKRAYSKKGKFEVTPMFFTAANPKFVGYAGAAVSASYHWRENLAVELVSSIPYVGTAYYSDMVFEVYQYEKLAAEDVDLKQMSYFGTANLQFTPLYGKLEFYNWLVDYDFYVSGGVGLVQTMETCVPNRDGCGSEVDVGRGLRKPMAGSDRNKFAGSIGGGMRLFFSNRFGVRVEMRDIMYSDRDTKNGLTTTDIRNNLLVFLGLAVTI
jgi:outer membrane beta-barrel protein